MFSILRYAFKGGDGSFIWADEILGGRLGYIHGDFSIKGAHVSTLNTSALLCCHRAFFLHLEFSSLVSHSVWIWLHSQVLL